MKGTGGGLVGESKAQWGWRISEEGCKVTLTQLLSHGRIQGS